jgi:hypothetical protein
MDDVVVQAQEAMTDRDWSTVRSLLHPYLHWTDTDGVTIRGRTRVLERLQHGDVPSQLPSAYELRDGQIYRWRV